MDFLFQGNICFFLNTVSIFVVNCLVRRSSNIFKQSLKKVFVKDPLYYTALSCKLNGL